MSWQSRVAKYRKWKGIVKEFPHLYRIRHDFNDECFCAILQIRDLKAKEWLNMDSLGEWWFHRNHFNRGK